MVFGEIGDLLDSSVLGSLLYGFLHSLLGSCHCQFLGLLLKLVNPLSRVDFRISKVVFYKTKSFDE